MTNRDSLLPADGTLSTAEKIYRVPFTFSSGVAASNGNTGLILPAKQIFGFNAGRPTTTNESGTSGMRVRYLITSLMFNLSAADVGVSIKSRPLTAGQDITSSAVVANIANYDAGSVVIGAFPTTTAITVLPWNPDGWAIINGALTITSTSTSLTGGGVVIYRELL